MLPYPPALSCIVRKESTFVLTRARSAAAAARRDPVVEALERKVEALGVLVRRVQLLLDRDLR